MHDEHGHHHGHHHDHDHAHDHDWRHHRHDHPGPGHNHAHGVEHLHSHAHGDGGRARAEELLVLATAFVDGFRAAADKNSYLRLAGVPFSIPGEDGLAMHLVDAAIVSNWQIGTASAAFASRELVYLPYPGKMIAERQTMNFTYVSLTRRADIDPLAFLTDRLDAAPPA